MALPAFLRYNGMERGHLSRTAHKASEFQSQSFLNRFWLHEKKLNRLDRGNIYAVIKDKPPSWTPVDLAGQFSLGETRRLLVDWNIVVVVLPGTGQLLGVCKPPNANAWSTVPLASLPQPSPASFVIGIAVDLSRQTSVTLGDGSTRRLPALVALNSDGSLRSFQLSPPSKEYPDCNV
ncbi:hypothetical protein ANCCAN_27683 [Ancylostoma caninum]|uniref:Uncharacterized protein n=1 Tax=Ancylostoma caninum TaxID=29170 RepID=A0A368F6I9_ANCCA|nr:hypothetical protein ANCCAN_27683 [Ancylostoma caninum]